MGYSVCIWKRMKNAYMCMWGLLCSTFDGSAFSRGKAAVWQLDMLEAPWSNSRVFEYAFWCQPSAWYDNKKTLLLFMVHLISCCI